MTARNLSISLPLLCSVAVASSAISVGCDQGEEVPPRWLFTSVAGVATAGGTESGVLSLTRAAGSKIGATHATMPAQVSITGTLMIVGGAEIALLGTVDDQTGFFEAAGGAYVFQGSEDRVTFQGGYEGPVGPGVFAGVWTSGDASVYCGQYSGTQTGILNLLQDTYGGDLGEVVIARGVFSESKGISGRFSVNISGNHVAFSFLAYSATGQISGDTLSGTWSSANGSESGAWQASSAACGMAGRLTRPTTLGFDDR